MLLISHQELFPFSTYLSFCLDFLVMQQNNLIRKIMLISNFMTSQPSYQAILIHILGNISRRKDNQTMKFGQLMDCNMRNIFLEKLYTKCGEETVLKNQNWTYLWINNLKFYKVCFYCKPSWGLSKYIETKLLLLHIRVFLEQLIEVWNLSPCLIFIISFEEKQFLLLYSINSQVS